MWGELGLPSLASSLLGPSPPHAPHPTFGGIIPLCDADPRGQSREQWGAGGVEELSRASAGVWDLHHLSGPTCRPHLTVLWGQGPLCPGLGGGARMRAEGPGATGVQPRGLHEGRGMSAGW